MRRKLYATCRDWRLKNPMDLDSNVTMNGGYNTEFFNQGQFADFAKANIVKISMPVPNERYVGKIPVIGDDEQPTGEFVPKLTRFVQLEYSDIYTNAQDLTASIEKTGAHTGVQVFATPSEALDWVKSNTDLEEVEPGKFLISPETDVPITGHVPAQYLTIE